MRLSRFVIDIPNAREHEHVLYDVIQDRYIGVDDEVLGQIQKARNEPDSLALTPEVEEVLRAEGFLVRERAEDDGRLRCFLEAAADGVPGQLRVTLMPTLACNLACTYCFQKDHPEHARMSAATEAATLEWILRKVDASACRVLHLHYFGGEPLTRKDYLLSSARVLDASMRARGGRFEWSITTNGVALDVPFVNAMLAFGQGSIKVTLDGDAQTHDAARVFRGGQGSFERIFSRMSAVARGCPEVKLWVGGNFRADQLDSYERLLDRIEAEGLGPLLHQLRFKPVVDSERAAGGSGCSGCGGRGQEETELQLRLARSIAERGLGRQQAEGATPTGPCELHWKNSYVIDPEGRVYKCPAVAGRPEMAVAHVRGPSVERAAPLLELRPWEKCGDCPYLPVCVGGCLGGKYLQTGRRDEVFCRKEQFDAAFRGEVIERYLGEFPDAVSDEAWCPSLNEEYPDVASQQA